MLDRVLSLLAALSLAFLVWLYARSRDQEILDNVPLPVHIMLPPHQANQFSVEVGGTSQVPVTFTGPPSRIKEVRHLLQRGELRIDVTLAVPEDRQKESRYLDTVRIAASEVPAPRGVTPVVAEGRNRLPVTVRRLVERQVPVRFDHSQEERLERVTVEPATVLVRGPEEVVERLHVISTQFYPLPACPCDTSTPQGLTVGPVPLVPEIDGRHVQVTPAAVAVHLSLRPCKKIYELEMPIQFLCPANFTLRPSFVSRQDGRIKLSIEGPAGEEEPVVNAYIDLTRRKFEPGLHHEPLRLQLPKDFEVVQPEPSLALLMVPFRLESPALAVQGLEGEHEP
jgi:hypothetical protein